MKLKCKILVSVLRLKIEMLTKSKVILKISNLQVKDRSSMKFKKWLWKTWIKSLRNVLLMLILNQLLVKQVLPRRLRNWCKQNPSCRLNRKRSPRYHLNHSPSYHLSLSLNLKSLITSLNLRSMKTIILVQILTLKITITETN